MKAHEVVTAWVTDRLRSGTLSVGDHLPSERTLAEELAVSRNTVREAMRILEALGTIRTSTGSGPTSGTIITAEPAQALTLALNMQLATSQVSHEHVYEMRLLLESWSASHADPAYEDWPRVARILERMEDPDLSTEQFLALDAQFHVSLSHAAGNPLISTMMDALRTSIADHTLERAHALPDWQATADRLRAEHREIFEAFRTGDHAQSVEHTLAHIRGYYVETSAETSVGSP